MKSVTKHGGSRGRRARGRVVVLGGGYAGTMAALRLAPYARVTLVDPSDRFTMGAPPMPLRHGGGSAFTNWPPAAPK